jgi:NAD(P)-dependent dehydrogenase (short-subunit alcohol dehydrogenase family)
MSLRPLENKVIVIIGGTGGMGLSAAAACIAAGARVVVTGRSAEHLAQAASILGQDAMVLQGDATDPLSASAAIDAAVQRFGALHGLYHVAGGSGRSWGDGPLDEIPDEGWEAALRLNLTSHFYSNRAAVRQFLAQGAGGSVLNMSSVLAESPSPRFFATHAYAAAKAAIIGLTRSAAAYYAPHNIRFNAIAPALVETPMSQRAAGDERIMRFIAAKQPLDGGRIGQPTDLDAAVVYFLADQSRFVTGQVLAIDGGWSVTDTAPTQS